MTAVAFSHTKPPEPATKKRLNEYLNISSLILILISSPDTSTSSAVTAISVYFLWLKVCEAAQTRTCHAVSSVQAKLLEGGCDFSLTVQLKQYSF